MSLGDFQRAMAGLVASGEFRLAVAGGDAQALQGYELDARERRRLVALARQPGLRVGEMIYRLNRALALTRFLPLTLALLGPNLKREIQLFWEAWPQSRLQFEEDVTRFAAFLEARLRSAEAFTPFTSRLVGEVLRYEMALARLGFFCNAESEAGGVPAPAAARGKPRVRLDPRIAAVCFARDPERMLRALKERRASSSELREEGEHHRLLDARRPTILLRRIGRRTARLLATLLEGGEVTPRAIGWLRRAGLVEVAPLSQGL
jgi:hypothetical protein